MKKVTIIVPVYNAEKTIDRCIESIINQTYKDIELLLINDGSKDKSIDILNKYKKKYSFIKVIDKKNEGVAKTRNLGIKKATGNYIMFIDNDDYIDHNYVEYFVNCIENKKVDVVVGGYKRENSLGNVIEKRILKRTEWSKYIIMAPWSKIYKKEFLLKNKIDFFSFPIGEDVYFTLKLISKDAKFYICDYVGYTWYYNDKSVSNTKQRGMNKDIDILQLLEQVKDIFKNKSNDYIKYYYYKYCVWYLLFSGRNTSKNQFIQEYRRYWDWLKDNKCNKVISPFSRKLKGELFRDRVAVLSFKIISNLHLINIFASIYCRGE